MSEFDPVKVEKTVISIRIPLPTLNKIDEYSAQKSISRNEFILQCINYALNNLSRK